MSKNGNLLTTFQRVSRILALRCPEHRTQGFQPAAPCAGGRLQKGKQRVSSLRAGVCAQRYPEGTMHAGFISPLLAPALFSPLAQAFSGSGRKGEWCHRHASWRGTSWAGRECDHCPLVLVVGYGFLLGSFMSVSFSSHIRSSPGSPEARTTIAKSGVCWHV